MFSSDLPIVVFQRSLVYHYPAEEVAIAGAKRWSFEVIKVTLFPLDNHSDSRNIISLLQH